MKTSISILLIFVILCSLVLPAGALESRYEVEFDPQRETISQAREINDLIDRKGSIPAKRDPAEDNLIVPGPLTEKCAYYIDLDQASFSFVSIQTGKSGQYFCVQLFAGKEAKGEPIFSYYEEFGFETGIKDVRVNWYFDSSADKIPEGQYTLISFTAEPRGNTLYSVDNTAYMTDVYFYRKYIAPQEGYLMDWETGKRLDSTLCLTLGETIVCAMGRSPLPSHGQAYINGKSELLSFEDVAGLSFITAETCGYSTLTLQYGEYFVLNYPVEICTQPGGHKFTQTITAGTPTEKDGGCTLSICEQCALVTRQYSPNLQETFLSFTDIPQNAWYYDFTREAVYNKLFNGINQTSFGPEKAMTRGMLVTVLWRYEGMPASSGDSFYDVPSDAWYAQAVNWAAEQGIVNGIGHGRFDPDGTITREQLTTILYRYGQKKAVDMSLTGDLNSFPDGADVSSWAKDAVSWSLGKALVSGVGKTDGIYLMPQGNATRAQVSAILIRFINSMLDPVPEVQYPDVTTAVDNGTVEGDHTSLVWAFYDSGLLQIGGTGTTPSPAEGGDVPWSAYKDQTTEIEILYGIGAVSPGTFSDYMNLRSVELADSVTLISNEAFSNCTSLERITLSDTVYQIHDKVFYGCTSLKSLTLPETLANLGSSAFEGCTSLEQVSFPENLRGIGAACFKGCTSLKEAQIPEAVLDNLGEKSFEDCTSLESVILPIGMKNMKWEIFSCCSSLKNVEMPLALEHMEFGIFGYCESLEALALPPYLKTMCYGTYTQCNSLKNLYIFSDILEIGVGRSYLSTKYYNDRPFGDTSITAVWGCSGYIKNLAEMFGYKYRDISELIL